MPLSEQTPLLYTGFGALNCSCFFKKVEKFLLCEYHSAERRRSFILFVEEVLIYCKLPEKRKSTPNMKIQQLSISYSDALNSHILSLQKGRHPPWLKIVHHIKHMFVDRF